MKQYLSAILSLYALIPFSSAQAQNHPERMVVRDTLGNVHSFLVERIRDVSFSKIEGRLQPRFRSTARCLRVSSCRQA